jgi:uncharacterized protein (DUF924 family)
VTITPAEVLDFWFDGDRAARRAVWFEQNEAFDAACGRFRDAVRAARSGALDVWADQPAGALALIILLDQFSRNLFRGQAEAFAGDQRALAIARIVIGLEWDQAMTPCERMFVYLPFEHAESLDVQDESVRLFESLRDALGGDTADYARMHRDVIRAFGRFPRRNAALGRESTEAEKEYLAQPSPGF